MSLVPLGKCLIAGSGAIERGVSIPDLARRMHELPSRSEVIKVVGPDASSLGAWLEERGRAVEVLGIPAADASGPDRSTRPEWRLWGPNPWVETVTREMEAGRALDLGCGCGRESVFLAANGWKMAAIDHLPDAITKAKDLEERYGDPHNRVQWIVGDAHQPCSQSFDLVLSLRFYDPALIALIPTLLNPGGTALIQAFSEAHRERTGRPSSEAFILSVKTAESWPGMRVVAITEDEKWRQIRLVREI